MKLSGLAEYVRKKNDKTEINPAPRKVKGLARYVEDITNTKT